MEKLKWIIIGIVIYLGCGWIAKKIVFSTIEITGDMTLSDIARYEKLAYTSIPIIISTISSILEDNEGKLCISLLLCLIISFIPYSMVSAIIFNIVNIGIIVWVTYTNKKINKKLNS